MYDIREFENETFGKVRTTLIDGEPWFVAADVCRALEIKNPSDALKRLDDDERMTLVSNEGHSGQRGGAQMMNLVSEPGLYTLALASRKPEAKAFKRWVSHDVLPSIRKHGAYISGQETLDSAELMAKALVAANAILEERAKKIREQERQIELLEPDAAFCREILSAPGAMLTTTVAKGLGMTARALNRWLCRKGVQFKSGGIYHLSKKYQGQDYARYETTVIDLPSGQSITRERLKWTQKGRRMIYDLLKEEGRAAGPADTQNAAV